MDFFGLMKQLFLRPDLFFKNNLKSDLLDTTFGIVAIILFILFAGIDRAEKTTIKILGKSEHIPIFTAASENWLYYWMMICVFGIIIGGIIYIVGGWFYGVRIKLSKGKLSGESHKKIYLYSYFFMGIAIILTTVSDTFLYSSPINVYLSEGYVAPLLENTIFFFIFTSLCHSFYISYKGAMLFEGISKVRAIIWFIAVPVIFYTINIIIWMLAIMMALI